MGSEPRNFTRRDDAGTRILVRQGFEWLVTADGRTPSGVHVIGRTAGGRDSHPVAETPDGERILLRDYRRGGAIRHFNHKTYFFGNRALDELRVTVAAADRGVRVPRVIAAIEWPQRFGYTARLMVEWIDGAIDLARWLITSAPENRAGMMRTVGEELARMHNSGISHPDLNLRNLLVVPGDEQGKSRVVIIDFDGATIRDQPLPSRLRRAALRRMTRSSWKLGVPVGIPENEALAEGYGASWPFDTALG
ncbi:MAG: hypothetical protein LBG44_09285 [Gemmatimonadota bacterium]|jgi:3-deoxy-D-manno-octulosonic acid kinase|nr:hypothetical protein [Gemmatimonadota bacterium]